MGEVYGARDTTLKRDVALKVLPAAVAHDPERMARFQREAELLASLNHPNIAIIHGLVESGGQRALVMELVAGETLAARIKRRRDAARRGAADRAADRRSPGGRARTGRGPPGSETRQRHDHARRQVKVLDFGLAAIVQGASSTSADPAELPYAHDGHDAGRRDHGHGGIHEPGAGGRHRRSIAAPTSGRTASCCGKCSAAGVCSAATRSRTRSPTCCAVRSMSIGDGARAD